MTTSIKSALVLVAALSAAACGDTGGGGGMPDNPPPQTASPVRCLTPAELPKVVKAKVSCFNSDGCQFNINTSMPTPPGETGYYGRQSRAPASRFLNAVHYPSGSSAVTVGRYMNKSVDIQLLPGFDTPTGITHVYVEGVDAANKITPLLDVYLCP